MSSSLLLPSSLCISCSDHSSFIEAQHHSLFTLTAVPPRMLPHIVSCLLGLLLSSQNRILCKPLRCVLRFVGQTLPVKVCCHMEPFIVRLFSKWSYTLLSHSPQIIKCLRSLIPNMCCFSFSSSKLLLSTVFIDYHCNPLWKHSALLEDQHFKRTERLLKDVH